MEFAPEGPMAIPLWINGHAFLTVSEAFFDVAHPVSGEIVRRVPLCGADEAAEAVAAASAAQPGWAAMGLMARRVCLGRLAEALSTYRGHFSRLLLQEIEGDETSAGAQVDAAVAALQDAAVGETGLVGVVLDASTPLLSFARAVAPALMAGATVVVKPSPKAPGAVYALCELSARAEWPAGVLNLLQGDSAALTGLCRQPLDRLVYAGEAALGAQIEAVAGREGCRFVSVG